MFANSIDPARFRFDFERRFYLGASLAFAILVFWTFARSYYLRPIFNASPLSLLLRLHGAVMSGWVVLLAVQSSLIAIRKVQWHRLLGAFGALWASLVVIMGSTMTLRAAAREVGNHTARAPVQVMIMGLELAQMLLFASFVIAAIVLRRRPDYHKRLMLLTIVCMLPSVLARLPIISMTNLMILLGLNLSVLAGVATDSLRNRRLHPAFGWGAALFLVAINLVFYAAQSKTWTAFGSWLVT